MEEIGPVILLVVAKGAEVGFKPFVVVLDLTLCLGVVCRGKSLINTKGLEEPACVVHHEHAASICIVDAGYSVGLPYVS